MSPIFPAVWPLLIHGTASFEFHIEGLKKSGDPVAEANV
jgi:hypothetical protein